MSDLYVPGLGGFRAAKTAAHRIVFRQGTMESFLAQGKIINGSLSRDSGNTGDLDVLRPGLLMGRITASGKYAPSLIGVLTQAEIATATTVTVSAAQAVELVRRIGLTGTLRFTGPPTAAGVVATFTETYSAVDTVTGIVTVSALDAALIAGSFLVPNDGSQIPQTLIPDGYGVKTTDTDVISLDVPFAEMPIAGVIEAGQVILWPTDTSLRQWIVDQLAAGTGKFIWSHKY